jgi:MFS family permease
MQRGAGGRARGPASGMTLRFLTGFFLAGVYPPGMKLMATWFARGRGAALGLLVGGITLGKAFPYLVNAIGRGDWRDHVLAVSAMAALGGAIVLLFVGEGPFATASAPFDVGQVVRVFRNRACASPTSATSATCGSSTRCGPGSRVPAREPRRAGRAAETCGDRVVRRDRLRVRGMRRGRAHRRPRRTHRGDLRGDGRQRPVLSLDRLLFAAPPAALLALAAIWGASIVADSAQFSACVTELADRRYIGTALTVQTCFGFLLTMVSIEIVPRLAASAGWRWAFTVLAIGPALGIAAMLRLRALPEAARIAGGRR